TTQSISPSTGGTYSVTVTNNGCSQKSADVSVTVATSRVSISPASPISICSGSSVTLTASTTTTYGRSAAPNLENVAIQEHYTWSTGATTSSITVASSGTYTVNVVTISGCTTSASVSVTVSTCAPPPPPPPCDPCSKTPCGARVRAALDLMGTKIFC